MLAWGWAQALPPGEASLPRHCRNCHPPPQLATRASEQASASEEASVTNLTFFTI